MGAAGSATDYAGWAQVGVALLATFVGPIAVVQIVKFFLFRAVAHSIPNAMLIRNATPTWTIEVESKRVTMRNVKIEIYPDEEGNSITMFSKLRNDDGGALSKAILLEGGCLEISVERLAKNRSIFYRVSMAAPGQPVVAGLGIGVFNHIHTHEGNRVMSPAEKQNLLNGMGYRAMVVMMLMLSLFGIICSKLMIDAAIAR
jgi:hypothetical protein